TQHLINARVCFIHLLVPSVKVSKTIQRIEVGVIDFQSCFKKANRLVTFFLRKRERCETVVDLRIVRRRFPGGFKILSRRYAISDSEIRSTAREIGFLLYFCN